MTPDDNILRDALRSDAGRSEPPPGAWDDVRTRASKVRRRRLAERGTAVVAAAAVIAGVLVGTNVFDRDEKHTIATPTTTAGRIAIAEQGENRVEIVAADDARVLDVVLEGDAARGVSGIAATPDGKSLLVSRDGHSGPVCPNGGIVPELVEVDLETGAIDQIVPGATHPVVSPDGRWVAYAMQDSCVGGYLGWTNLQTREHFRKSDDEPLMPVAWSTDSGELLYRFGDPSNGIYRFVTPSGDGEPVEGQLPPGTTAAAYMTPDAEGFRRFYVGLSHDDGYAVGTVEKLGLLSQRLFVVPQALSPRELSVSRAGDVLVVEAEGRTVVWSPGDEAAHVIGNRIVGAAWLPGDVRAPGPPTTVTTRTSSSLPSVQAPSTLVVATADRELQVIDTAGNVLRVLVGGDGVTLGYQRVQLGPDGVTLYYDQFDDPCGDAGGGFTLEHYWNTVRIDEDPLGFGHHGGAFSALSPDGTKVAYRLGSCSASAELVIYGLQSRNEKRFTLAQPDDGGPVAELVGPVAWDADGRHLMLRVNREPATDFWYVDTAGTGDELSHALNEPLPTFAIDFAPLGDSGGWAAIYSMDGGLRLVESSSMDPAAVRRAVVAIPFESARIAGIDRSGAHVLFIVDTKDGPQLYRWSAGETALTFVASNIVAADW